MNRRGFAVSQNQLMLCFKCQQHEATIHLTTVVDGKTAEAVHLCKNCAPAAGFDWSKLKPEEIEALSVLGKKCEFCGRAAFSGEIRADGSTTYWCSDCGLERTLILGDLLVAERPDIFQRPKEEISFLSLCSDPEFRALSASMSERATQILKQRKASESQ